MPLGALPLNNLFHAFFTRFLFFEKLFLARNISAITLGDHVLAEGFDCLTRYHVGTDGSLNGDVKLLP